MAIRPIDPAKRALYVKPSASAQSPMATPVPAIDKQTDDQPAKRRDAARHAVARPRTHASNPRLTGDAQSAPMIQATKPAKRAHHIVDKSGPNWDEYGDYAVGKNRPPVHTRWKKGQSGNPRGPKPKDVVDPQTAFDNEVLAAFTAKVNGEEVTLNMGTFAVQLLKAGAAKGGVQSQKMLLELFLTTLARRLGAPELPAIDAAEQKAVDEVLEELGLSASPVFRKIDRTGKECES